MGISRAVVAEVVDNKGEGVVDMLMMGDVVGTLLIVVGHLDEGDQLPLLRSLGRCPGTTKTLWPEMRRYNYLAQLLFRKQAIFVLIVGRNFKNSF